jgi:hypothetical protein
VRVWGVYAPCKVVLVRGIRSIRYRYTVGGDSEQKAAGVGGNVSVRERGICDHAASSGTTAVIGAGAGFSEL